MMRSILSLILLIGILSCNSDPEVIIDPELQPYVDKFLAEAAQRGQTIDLSLAGLTMAFEEDISTADYSGICRYRIGSNEIGIDKEVWGRLEEPSRDRLIYHELGHCVLDRGHRNDKFDNGMWKSLMRGDPLEGIEWRLPICYIWEREQYYIDELFDEDAPAPDWIGPTFDYNMAPPRGEELVAIEDTEGFDRFLSEGITDFEFEYVYWKKGNSRFVQMRYGTSNTNFHAVTVDHENDEFIVGNDITFCTRIPFENEVNNKITVRQMDGITSVFVNEQFMHSYPSFPEEVTRVWKTGDLINIREFKLWSLQ